MLLRHDRKIFRTVVIFETLAKLKWKNFPELTLHRKRTSEIRPIGQKIAFECRLFTLESVSIEWDEGEHGLEKPNSSNIKINPTRETKINKILINRPTIRFNRSARRFYYLPLYA